MNKHLTAFLIAFILCLSLCSCAKEEPKPTITDTVSLWCVEGFPAADALGTLVDEFNAIPYNNVRVELRHFVSEDALALSFNSMRPDLMLCYSDRAWTIMGMSDCISVPMMSELILSPGFEMFSESVFLPIGGELSLLLSRKGTGVSGLTLPKLCARAKNSGKEFIAVSCCADLFAASMDELESEFHFDIGADKTDSNFAYLFNMLAELAFSGSLRLCAKPAEAVANGELSCAVVRSEELTGLELSDCEISSMPDMTLEKSQFIASVIGLAVTAEEGRGAEGINAFLSWLVLEKRLGSAALRCGLLPATAFEPAEDPLSQAIEALAGECRLYSHSGVYSSLRDGFDRQMLEALKLVY